jgi:hypothetical protein
MILRGRGYVHQAEHYRSYLPQSPAAVNMNARGQVMISTSLARPASLVDQLCSRHAGLDSLLVRVGNGNCGAFAGLYDEVSQTVYAMSLLNGHDPRVSEEVTYAVFVKVWRQARAYDPEAGSAWTWLRAIALEAIQSQRPAAQPGGPTIWQDTSGVRQHPETRTTVSTNRPARHGTTG